MKRILLLFAFLGVIALNAQNINSLEYFVDSDPGYGQATSVSVIPGQQIDESFTVPVAALTDGIHLIGIRTRQENGTWGQTLLHFFLKQPSQNGPLPQISQAEYFIDNDPGYGQATSVSVIPGQQIDESFTVPVAALTDGIHLIGIRTRQENGAWGQTLLRFFLKQPSQNGPLPQISQAEYFFDTDPGFGLATRIDLPEPASNMEIEFISDLNALPNGQHILFVRTKDENGRWSFIYHEIVDVSVGIPTSRAENTVQVFPNPASHIINVEVAGPGDAMPFLVLISPEGKIVKKQAFSQQENTSMDVAGIKPGTYFLKIDFGESQMIKKIIIHN